MTLLGIDSEKEKIQSLLEFLQHSHTTVWGYRIISLTGLPRICSLLTAFGLIQRDFCWNRIFFKVFTCYMVYGYGIISLTGTCIKSVFTYWEFFAALTYYYSIISICSFRIYFSWRGLAWLVTEWQNSFCYQQSPAFLLTCTCNHR